MQDKTIKRTLSRAAPGFEDLVMCINGFDDGEAMEAEGLEDDALNTLADRVIDRMNLQKELKRAKSHEDFETKDMDPFLSLPRNAKVPLIERKKTTQSTLVVDTLDSTESMLVNKNYYGIVHGSPISLITHKKEKNRSMKWGHMCRRLTKDMTSMVHVSFMWSKKLIPRVIKGIPNDWRSFAWPELIATHSRLYLNMNMEQIRGLEDELIEVYYALRSKPSDQDQVISDFVNNTMRYHVKYYQYGKGRETLEDLVTAIHHYHPTMALCREWVNWVALFHTFCNAELVFLMAVHLLCKPVERNRFFLFNMSPLFTSDHRIAEFQYAHENLLQIHLPLVYNHLVTCILFRKFIESRQDM